MLTRVSRTAVFGLLFLLLRRHLPQEVATLPRRLWNLILALAMMPLCALTAVGVEWLQWVTATGAADVDDSILNFLGAALGYLLVRLCQLAAGRRKNK